MGRRLHMFGDEAGNYDFSLQSGASRCFIICTVTFFDDFQACRDLQQLRLDLAWEDVELRGPFHATTDDQAVRDRVFAVLAPHDFRADATILEKPKAQPQLRVTEERFFKYAWFYHMKYVASQVAASDDELLVVAASVGTKKKRAAFSGAFQDVMGQMTPRPVTRTAFWDAAADPGLQIADYCAWAIQRKWERGDLRSHVLIAGKIKSEFELFRASQATYY